jgi:hypothetical protein
MWSEVRKSVAVPWQDKLLELFTENISKGHNEGVSKVATLVPLYRIPSSVPEWISIATYATFLPNTPIYIIAPSKLRAKLEAHNILGNGRFRKKYFSNTYFGSIRGYNRLLLSESFYRQFLGYEYVLIGQTDALVLGNESQLLSLMNLGFSYYGAPWIRSEQIEDVGLTELKVGNGGFSLRNPSRHLALLSSTQNIQFSETELRILSKDTRSKTKWAAKVIAYKTGLYKRFPVYNEDRFICEVLAQRVPEFTICTAETALDFAFEQKPEMLYEQTKRTMPFGCHAWEKYGLSFWNNIIEENWEEIIQRI